MIRPIVGLTLACLLVGCGGNATEPADATAEQDASAAVQTDATVVGSDLTAATSATSGTHAVYFHVPGMT